MMREHLPVMLEPVLELLSPHPGNLLVDGTVGGAGHAEAIARRLAGRGKLIALDRDPDMLDHARKRLGAFGPLVQLVHARFSQLENALLSLEIERVDGILLDLGLCTLQLDSAERGFRFGDADSTVPLDMRMDRTGGNTVAELLDKLDEEELAEILREGGVHRVRIVARALRAHRPIRSTAALLHALDEVRLPRRRHHPATLVFQALRIAVNDEYHELVAGLEASADLLSTGGRLVVLSYHSGEDRRVKQFFAREARGCICPPDLPVCGCGRVPRFRILARGTGPQTDEVVRNPRSRSARLRAGERL